MVGEELPVPDRRVPRSAKVESSSKLKGGEWKCRRDDCVSSWDRERYNGEQARETGIGRKGGG